MYGDVLPQAIYIIPQNPNLSQYHVLHLLNEYTGFDVQGINVIYNFVDMSENNGHGKVILKNQPVVTVIINSAFAFVKHGNGKDWGGLFQKRRTNCCYRILINENGAVGTTNSNLS